MGRVYLYGIIESTQEVALDVAGVNDAGPVLSPSTSLRVNSAEGPVRVALRDGLGCVTSKYNGEAFGALSREELVKLLFAHQRVVERVMQHHAILPVKFGTLLKDSQEVLALLSQGREEFPRALAAIRDKVEMEVAATWDTSRVLRELSTEPEVARAREAIAAKSRGDSRIAPTLEDQVKLGQVVKALIDKRRDGYRERMVSFLKPLAVDMASNVLVSDEMVMNVAFLVERAREQQFDEAVRQLDRLFEDQIHFRVIGPLPPYSFSTVAITRITSEQLEAARQTLGLGAGQALSTGKGEASLAPTGQAVGLPGILSEADVRRAYRRMAAQKQRSLHSGDEEARAELARIREASEVLLGYLRASRQPPSSPLTKGEIKEGAPFFRIIIKRSEAEDLPHFPTAKIGDL